MNKPVRLNKQVNQSWSGRLDAFTMKYAYIILPILFIMLVIIVTVLVVALVQASNPTAPSMVESGNYYNQFKNII